MKLFVANLGFDPTFSDTHAVCIIRCILLGPYSLRPGESYVLERLLQDVLHQQQTCTLNRKLTLKPNAEFIQKKIHINRHSQVSSFNDLCHKLISVILGRRY